MLYLFIMLNILLYCIIWH